MQGAAYNDDAKERKLEHIPRQEVGLREEQKFRFLIFTRVYRRIVHS